MKKRICLFLSISVIFLFTLPVFASAVYATSNIANLNIIRYEQEKSKWCWAACAKMVGQYELHSSPSQTDIVIYTRAYLKSIKTPINLSFSTKLRQFSLEYGKYSCEKSACLVKKSRASVQSATYQKRSKFSNVNEGASDDEITRAITYANDFRYTVIPIEFLDLSDIQSFLRDDKYPVVLKMVWNSGGAHALVVDAFDGSTIRLVDPWYGCSAKNFYPYSFLTSSAGHPILSGTGHIGKYWYLKLRE